MPLPPLGVDTYRKWAADRWKGVTDATIGRVQSGLWDVQATSAIDALGAQMARMREDQQRQQEQERQRQEAVRAQLEEDNRRREAEAAQRRAALSSTAGGTLGGIGERVGASFSGIGQTAQRGVQGLQTTAGGWADRAEDAIGGLGAALPGGAGWDADLARIRGEREAIEQQYPTPEPTGPAGFTLPQTGTPEGERITSALAETAMRETPGGQTVLAAARAMAPQGPMTADTPGTNVLGIGQAAMTPWNVTQGVTRGVTQAVPGGETSVFEGQPIPRWVPGVGGQRLTAETPVLGGLTTPDEALPFAVGIAGGTPREAMDALTMATRPVTALAEGVPYVYGRAGALGRRLGGAVTEETAPLAQSRAVAGFGRPSITGAPSGARFGIEGAIEDDIEGQVARRITDPPAVVQTIQGAPGSHTAASLRGAPRTSSPYEVPAPIAQKSGARLEPMDVDELVNPRLPAAQRAAPENQRRVTRTVRTADTLYDYLSGMADDYADYRDFYPDFGRFYRSIAEPAGEQADGVFNELSALWAATAAQTAPHDNLTKALTASLAARKYRQVVGREPTSGEVYRLLMEGVIVDGARIEGGGNTARMVERGTVVAQAPDVALHGGARKLTMEDAKKIAQTWETGTIEIPSNFKLTAFNLLNALAARSRYSPFSVIDTHMFRLFGYADPGAAGGSPEASRFVQATIERLAREKGWSPHQLQSALWYGAKNEVAPPSAVGVRFADKVPLTKETFGLPAGTEVDDGTLAYSVERNRPLIEQFMAEAAPQGPINENAARATVVFPGKRSARGRPLFRLDTPAQERAETWMENRGYAFTVPVSDAALRALDYDPATGTLGALAARNLPAQVVRHPDGSLAVQLYTQSDEGAREAARVVGAAPGMTAEAPEPLRPLLDTAGGATGRVFQVDKADGTRWTGPELEAARQAGVPATLSPDGRSLVARADDLGEGVDEVAVRDALEGAGAPPVAVQTVPVRAAYGRPGQTPVVDDVLGIRRGQRMRMPTLTAEQQAQRARDGAAEQRVFDAIRSLWRRGPEGEAAADELRFLAVGKGEAGEAAARDYLAAHGLQDVLPAAPLAGITEGTGAAEGMLGLARRATEPLMARGAMTQGERAFDVAVGTAGGVAGAVTAEEDATWQERAARGALGASLGGLAGANVRQLGRVGQRALAGAPGGDEALGAVSGQQLALPGVGKAPRSRDLLSDVTTVGTGLGLANPASLAANLTGGVMRTATRVARELAGETGNPLHAFEDVVGMAVEVPRALARLPRSIWEGPTPQARALTGASIGSGLENRQNLPALVGTFGTRANAATDQLIRAINEAGASRVARARGRTGVERARDVQRAGEFATYQSGKSSPLADLMSQSRSWLADPQASTAQRLAGGVLYGFAPYVRMPERLLVESLKTITDPVTQALPLVQALRKGDKAAMREARARIAVGGAASALFYRLVARRRVDRGRPHRPHRAAPAGSGGGGVEHRPHRRPDHPPALPGRPRAERQRDRQHPGRREDRDGRGERPGAGVRGRGQRGPALGALRELPPRSGPLRGRRPRGPGRQHPGAHRRRHRDPSGGGPGPARRR